MKRILALTAGMLLVAATAFAGDIDTGEIELEGSSNGLFSSTGGDGDTETELNLDVAGRYYLMPNLGVGGSIGYAMSRGPIDSTLFTIGPEAIYNISLAEAVNAYAGINVGFASDDNGTITDNGLFAGAGGGIKYFFAESASLNCGLSYSHFFGDFGTNRFGINIGISIFLE